MKMAKDYMEEYLEQKERARKHYECIDRMRQGCGAMRLLSYAVDMNLEEDETGFLEE